MKKTDIILCDICKKTIANKKCSLCDKDICDGCLKTEDIGTLTLYFCDNCLNKLEMSGFDRQSFWNEFNTQENMQEKIVQYLKKSLILKNLSDDKDEDEGEYEFPSRRIGKRRKGSWAKSVRGDSI